MAGFRPQANLPFVAVYVADANGYFEEEGLDVTIRHSAGADEHIKLLLEGEVAFTTGTAAQSLRQYAEGLPLRAVALFGQRGDQGFVTRAGSGIRSPADFRDRSVGFKAGVVPAELHALLATAGLSVDDVNLQAVGFDPRVFIEGQVDVYPVFLNNEPDTIRRAGVEINVIDPHEYGVPTLGVVYLAREETVADDPDLVERFLRAALRGAAWGRDHVEEAVEITLTFADGASADHQRFLLETDLASAHRDDGMGRSTPDQWEALAGGTPAPRRAREPARRDRRVPRGGPSSASTPTDSSERRAPAGALGLLDPLLCRGERFTDRERATSPDPAHSPSK